VDGRPRWWGGDICTEGAAVRHQGVRSRVESEPGFREGGGLRERVGGQAGDRLRSRPCVCCVRAAVCTLCCCQGEFGAPLRILVSTRALLFVWNAATCARLGLLRRLCFSVGVYPRDIVAPRATEYGAGQEHPHAVGVPAKGLSLRPGLAGARVTLGVVAAPTCSAAHRCSPPQRPREYLWG
jgi:hypothetical protein